MRITFIASAKLKSQKKKKNRERQNKELYIIAIMDII